MKTTTFLFIITILFSIFSQSFSKERCNPHDKKVLLDIKASFGNPYALASWKEDTDCCTWYVVKCDRVTNRITSFTLFADNLNATIPNAIADLPYLQTLMFHKLPNLIGTIPVAISKLVHLQMLTLSNTNLTGPVPSFLTNLKNLTFLDLSFNDLTGTIPPSLSELTNLGAIRLDRNKLTGTIPDSFGTFTGSVPDLYLSHNNLTGTVPKSLGNLNFSTIDFSRNKLQGDASFLFGANKTIQTIDLSRNMFNFDISNVNFPAIFENLDLNHNMITGTLPADLTKLNLQFLNVSYNRLCGQIPQGGSLQKFDIYSYFHNKCLCGSPLPACS